MNQTWAWSEWHRIYTMGHKNVLLHFCPYLCHIFKILSLSHSADILQYCDYYISHHIVKKASLHYLVKDKCKKKLMIITIIEWKRKHFRPTLQWMIYMTLDHFKPTQSSVIQCQPQCWSEVFFYLPKYLFVVIVIYVYLTYILQGSIEMHLRCGGIYKITSLLQIVRRVCHWKNFENWPICGKDIDKVACFYWPTL